LNSKHKPLGTFVFLIVLSLILPLLFPQIQAVDSAVQGFENDTVFLIATFKNANQSITKTISNLEAKAVVIPQPCIETFREAQDLGNQAIALNQQGMYTQAKDVAMQALQKIRETLNLLNSVADETPTDQEENYKRSLQNTIDRDYSLLERFENVVASASSHGTNITIITPKLSALKTNLDAATICLNQEKLEQAIDKSAQAQTLIDELTGYFKTLAATLNVEKVSAYITEAEHNLVSLEEQVNSPSSNLSSSTKAAASATITQAQTSLDKAKQYLDSQQIVQTINELTTVQASQQTVQNYINTVSPTPSTSKTTPSPSTPTLSTTTPTPSTSDAIINSTKATSAIK
jgi:tetratricopeptide (TPR) repeat protein